jgi:hypothetical protein
VSSSTPKTYTYLEWSHSLLLFDANSGALLAQRDLGLAGLGVDLHATSQGNFILELDHLGSPSGGVKQTLLLFSPAGEKVKELDLPTSTDPRETLWTTLMSPTRSTLLARQQEPARYEILDANSLEVRFAGAQANSDPAVVSIRDQAACLSSGYTG